MNLPEGAERPSIPIRGLCVRKSRKSEEVKGSAPKTALSMPGTSPPKTYTGGWGRVTAKPADADEGDTPVLDRGEAAGSTAVVFCGGLRQAGRKSAFPLALVLEGVAQRGEELEPPRVSRAVVPYFTHALQ